MKRRFALIALVLVLFGVALARDGVARWVAQTQMPSLQVETSTEVLDRHGHLLRAYTVDDGRWRMAVTLDQVDPLFVDMLVAYEDKRFYRHGGVDLVAATRAVAQALWNGKVISGGSTLTMQVARLLEDGPTGRWRGKLRQVRVALALEHRLSKAQILGLYLNRAPYGGNLEGVRAATLAWFGKEPRRLTPAQAALLVALPQSPETRRPDRFPGAAAAARARVLARVTTSSLMGNRIAGASLQDPVPTRRVRVPALAAHMSDRARREAPARPVHRLTLDADLQARLETLSSQAVRDYGEKLSIAMVVADHRTGEILASVGSAGYRTDGRQGFVDMTRAYRSPGSTLKPLVFAMAFDDGLAHPETLIEDRPTLFGSYAPENFDGAYRGTVKVADALKMSLNIPAVSLTDAVGPARLMAALRRAQVDARLPGNAPAGLAVILGGVGVTVEDMAGLYAALGNGGQSVPLHHRMQSAPPPSTRVISPQAAWQVGHILAGMPAPPNAPRNRLAYKTGTSYGHRDTWAIGFDGGHVIAVWMGRADGTPVPGAFGADLAAPILFEAFARLKPELDPLGPPPPATLMLSNAALPIPLRAFRPRDALFQAPADAPLLAFPPDGAVIETQGATLVVKVREGIAPFTWLANGAPVLVGTQERESELALPWPGFVTLSVIDSAGRSARAQVELR